MEKIQGTCIILYLHFQNLHGGTKTCMLIIIIRDKGLLERYPVILIINFNYFYSKHVHVELTG